MFVVCVLADLLGQVYIFSNVGGAYTEQSILQPNTSTGNSAFGISVAGDAGNLAVGAKNDGDLQTGLVYLFYTPTASAPTELELFGILSPSVPVSSGGFGVDVALQGDYVLVGSSGAGLF